MVLKNKDGSVYKLRSPNPIGKKQDEGWKKDEIVLHNFSWGESKVDDITPLNPYSTIANPKPDPVPDPAPIPEIKYSVDTIPVETPQPQPSSKFKVTVSFYCLPAEVKTVKDTLYGEIYQRRTYGKKFSFEAIVIEATDLKIRFWSTIDKLSKGSIVYPYRYSDGQPYSEYRWWEIYLIEEKSGGFLIEAAPSKDQPDFSL